jgi:hypothetical protein
LNELLSQCKDILPSGTLNVYLTEISITPDIVASVIEAVRQLSGDTSTGRELYLPDKAYLAYDPALYEMLVPRVKDLPGEAYAFPVTDPAYRQVKAKLEILTPMHAVTDIKSSFSNNRSYRAKLIIRIHRPVMDSRAWGKAEQEYKQLPFDYAGVVVIDMSRTSMSVRPEHWARDIHESFLPEYTRMSAVWLRSGLPIAGAKWQEYLLVNPYANIKLSKEIVESLIPGASSVNFS